MAKYELSWFANRILYLDIFLKECIITLNLNNMDYDLLTAWCENE